MPTETGTSSENAREIALVGIFVVFNARRSIFSDADFSGSTTKQNSSSTAGHPRERKQSEGPFGMESRVAVWPTLL